MPVDEFIIENWDERNMLIFDESGDPRIQMLSQQVMAGFEDWDDPSLSFGTKCRAAKLADTSQYSSVAKKFPLNEVKSGCDQLPFQPNNMIGDGQDSV